MATLQEIEKLLDAKLENLRAQITTDIENKLQQKIDENARNISGNATSIEGQAQQIETLKEQHKIEVDELTSQLKKLTDDLDEQVNRSMRSNIVVKGLPEDPEEDWSVTKSKLCDFLATLSTETPQLIYERIDRAHRGGKRSDDKPRNIYVNFVKSVDANYFVDQFVKSRVKKSKNNLNNSSSPQVRIDHQYSKALEDRRNLAMIERRKLLDTKKIAMGHVAYPAKLLVKDNAKDR